LPDDEPTAANKVLLLDHVPPVVADESTVEVPAQTVKPPEIADGNAFTVTADELVQPVDESV
jgi:hypothetical protein